MREPPRTIPPPKGPAGLAVGARRTIPAALALATLFLGASAVRTSAQESLKPAPPAAASPASEDTHQQEGSPTTTTNKFKVTIEVVNVPVTALNKRGHPVIDLTKDDFQVFEDGVPQNIKYFNRETQMPLRVGLILDTSNSARRQLPYEKDAASQFVFTVLRSGNTRNQVFLQTFDATSSFVQDFTNDPDKLNEKIEDLKSGGGKALYDAIYAACKEKLFKSGQPEEMRRILVILSDGLDVQSQHTLDEAISIARMSETMIYTICTAAYGYNNPGDKLLMRLASSTGGAAFFPLQQAPGTDMETGYLSHGQVGDTSQNKGLGAETGKFSAERLVQMADSLDAIGRELDEQYTLGYTPTRNALDGTYRTIKVVAVRRGVSLRWKPGYFASPE